MTEKVSENENFFEKAFDYFGVKWPQLTALSGILFSGFGFQEYINPATWTMASIGAFLLVYTIKEYVSDRYLRNIVLTAAFYITIAIAFAVMVNMDVFTLKSFSETVSDNSPVASAIIALIVSGNIAILIISYFKHQRALPLDIPDEFREAIGSQYFADSLHRGVVRYDIIPISRENGLITYNIKLRYSLHNIASTRATTEIEYPSPGQQLDIHSINIAGEEKDPANRNYYTDIGLRIPCTVPAKDKIDISIDATETFPDNGNDIFTSKLPAQGMVITVKDYEKFDMSYQFESNIKDTDAVVDGNNKLWKYEKVILSNQGIRLRWSPCK